jgi:hypothetical protein
MNRLKPILDHLKSSEIESIHIDFDKESLVINLNKNDYIHFQGVKSLLYLESNDDSKKNSLEFSKEGLMEFIPDSYEFSDEEDENFEDYIASPNFSLVYNEKSILFEADSLIYKGEKIGFGLYLN